jgi:hypothetical protein
MHTSIVPTYHVLSMSHHRHIVKQLLKAAQNGKSANVDRLIKDGANKEAEDWVRTSFH